MLVIMLGRNRPTMILFFEHHLTYKVNMGVTTCVGKVLVQCWQFLSDSLQRFVRWRHRAEYQREISLCHYQMIMARTRFTQSVHVVRTNCYIMADIKCPSHTGLSLLLYYWVLPFENCSIIHFWGMVSCKTAELLSIWFSLSFSVYLDCLSSFTDLEQLDETELYMCHKCKKRQKSTKKFWIQKLPKVGCISQIFFFFFLYFIAFALVVWLTLSIAGPVFASKEVPLDSFSKK